MAITNRASIQSQLIPGLNAIVGLEYGSVANEHLPLYQIETSERAFEEEVMMSGLGTANVKPEGESTIYDDIQETYKARYTMTTISLGFNITQEALEDNLYETFSKARAISLARAMANTKQLRAAHVFNNAFSTSHNGGDGVPLISASHPVLIGGTQSNLLTGDLAEATLETGVINASLLLDERGVLIGSKAVSLHVPPALQFAANKILRSELSTTTVTAGSDGVSNVNDINALRNGSYLSGGYFINHRFSDSDAWFLKTDVPNSTKMFTRVSLETSDEGDFDTGNIKYKARERYAFGFTDWRGWLGSPGA